MNDLISVIIPVYNVEKYLDKCLDSVVNQTYTNLEIILVDDGSTDESGDICDSWSQKDSRIRVIHKDNGGVSSARNVGIDIAEGEYIAFVDPDDYVILSMFEYIMQEIDDDQTDILEYNYYNVSNGMAVENGIRLKVYDDFQDVLLAMFSSYLGLGITKIYRHSVIGSIRFNCKYAIAEDTLFFVECCKNARKLKSLEKPVYYYIHHDASVTHKPFHDRMFDLLNVLEYIGTYCRDGIVATAFKYHYIYQCFDILSRVLMHEVCLNKLHDLRAILLKHKKHILFEKPIKVRTGFRKYGIKQKIFVLLLWVCPNFFYSFYPLYHKFKNWRKNDQF